MRRRSNIPGPVRVFTVCAILAVAPAGCFVRGGPWYSGNAPLTYVSTPVSAKTVSVIDTRTGETVWSKDVPVGKKLVIQFDENEHKGAPLPAEMNWGLLDAGEIHGELENTVPAPPVDSRRVDMTITYGSGSGAGGDGG